jgi:hypothetical protein
LVDGDDLIGKVGPGTVYQVIQKYKTWRKISFTIGSSFVNN